jgi:uncharacterized sporulation protein YeaH/YhbH (DUF444 family)
LFYNKTREHSNVTRDFFWKNMRIGNDHARFKKIIKGKIRKNLKQYIKQGEMIGKVGKQNVSIPMPSIDTPRFIFDPGQAGGVGQGDAPGQGKPGQEKGEHSLEVDVSLDELAEILGEELELPNIQPKGKSQIEQEKIRYKGIRQVGPEGLKHFKRTYREALKRQISSGSYNPDNPIIIPRRNDKRYKSFKKVVEPDVKAVVIQCADVSGSMGAKQKEIVRTECFWIDTWLQKQYKNIESRFVIHDSAAKEVDRETFFTTNESGGTMISSGLELCADIITKDYPVNEYNIYINLWGDGDNWSEDDNLNCVDLLKNYLIPVCNQFAYGQVESQYGSGEFINVINEHFVNENKVVTSQITSKDDIMKSIKEILGKGN